MRPGGRVLLAGGTGALGREVAKELASTGYRVRRLVRQNPGPNDVQGDLTVASSLHDVCKDVEAVISCAGASMKLDGWRDHARFTDVDEKGTRNLIENAVRAGVRRFVYVSLAEGPKFAHTEYASSHERAVDDLSRSGLSYVVVRPTGLFSFYSEVFKMAAQGRGIVVGKGEARTNPIHDADAARACVHALALENENDLPVGGPVTYTRKEVVELALKTAGRKVVTRGVPPWVMDAAARAIGLFNPRIGALIQFGSAVSQADCLAPAWGTRQLDDYFRELARAGNTA